MMPVVVASGLPQMVADISRVDEEWRKASE